VGIGSQRPLKLDVGSGATRGSAEYVGADAIDAPGVDVVGDLTKVLRSRDDESVTKVYSSHLFDHIDELEALMREIEHVVVRLRLESARLHFRSSTEFRTRDRPKEALGRFVNANGCLKEFYEENLYAVFPWYELEFELVKVA
jgi:hypothetical protein